MRFQALDDRVIDLLKNRGAQRILDVGCGNGRFAKRVAAAGLEITGIDPRAAPSQGHGFQLLKTRLQDFTSDGHFDAAVLSFTLHSISPAERIEFGQNLLHRHLKPDGLIVVIDYQKPEPTLLNGLLWLGVWFDELLTVFIDGNTEHLKYFQNYILMPFKPQMLGLNCERDNATGITLFQLQFPFTGSLTETTVRLQMPYNFVVNSPHRLSSSVTSK